MFMMKRFSKIHLIAFLGLFVMGLTGSAQDKGIVRFMVDVDNSYFQIELNDTFLLKRHRDTLPAGNYTGKVWSPGYEIMPIEFKVVAGLTTEKYVKMVKNQDFITYEKEYKVYRSHFHKQLTLPLTVSLAGALTTGFFMTKAYTSKKLVMQDLDLYDRSPSPTEIDEIKVRIDENNARYNRQRFGFYVSTGLTLACVGTTIWSYRHFKRTYTEPTFNKESPFEEKYSFNLTPYGCSLAIKL
jgi:hypothetical protein